MRLTPVERLVPGVTESDDRLVFLVASRSRKGKQHRVDMEQRHGIGICSCEDCRINGNPDCSHLTAVRKYLAVKLCQSVIKANQP